MGSVRTENAETHQGTANAEIVLSLARRLLVSLPSKPQADQGKLGAVLSV
jgi:hypothetical protein